MAKTYTNVPTVSTLATYPSATYNTYTAQNINNLIVPPMCKLNYSTTQAITTATNTIVTWDTSEFDTDAMGTTGAGAKITANTAGVYLVSYEVWFAGAAAATGTRFAGVIKNGTGSVSTYPFTNTYGLAINYSTILNSSGPNFAASFLLSLAANDYIQLQVHHTQGTNLNICDTKAGNNFLSAVWIGRTS